MPWVYKQAATVDGRGNVYCTEHADHARGEIVQWDADNSALDSLTCDAPGCGAVYRVVYHHGTRPRGSDRQWIRDGKMIDDLSERVHVSA